MRTVVHANSLAAFDEIAEQRSERADAIYRFLLKSAVPMTDRQIMQALGFLEPNAVRPRVTELVDARWLVEHDSVECPVTGKRVRRTIALTMEARAALIARQRATYERRHVSTPQLLLSFA